MSENAIFLTANWLGLGSGPLLLSVLSGTAVVLRADDTPAISRLLAPAAGGLVLSGNSIAISSFRGVAAGALFKMNPAGTGMVAAVAGTDYQAPYSGIDSGTA